MKVIHHWEAQDSLPFISAIVPAYNDRDRLLKCLKALYLQTYLYNSYEVIVVDNNSTENIYSVCQQFPNVRYLQENKQGSYAARNCGVKAAKGEIIAFTDADCLPAANWISSGVRSLLSNPDAGIVAGHIEMTYLQSQPKPVEYADRLMHLNQQHYAEKGYAATGNAFTWVWMFERVGLFNEGLLSLGDREWGERVTLQGYRVVYSKEAYVQHPARNTLHALLKKVRFQAQYKPLLKPWM
ncbi:glycosyl transferase [Cyanosarcina cf. burmensis CCALA 770]|nr:glycosyl transferase [Cyanosarcina cf. burmensis CCALA 770]